MSLLPPSAEYFFRHIGTCPICEKTVEFVATGPHFRDTLQCTSCGSVPRQRVLMTVLSSYFPKWRDSVIHEGSPGWDPLSQRLARECKLYVASQYDVSIPRGVVIDAPQMPCKRYQSENLEDQTFPDEHFDIVITQDVFEHVFRPDVAIQEIARTLKPGGATIMTVPIVMCSRPSQRRAAISNGTVEHISEPQYHGNPLGGKGSLVTIDWGYDIVAYLEEYSGLSFIMIKIDNIDLGIRADLNEVLVGFKLPISAL